MFHICLILSLRRNELRPCKTLEMKERFPPMGSKELLQMSKMALPYSRSSQKSWQELGGKRAKMSNSTYLWSHWFLCSLCYKSENIPSIPLEILSRVVSFRQIKILVTKLKWQPSNVLETTTLNVLFCFHLAAIKSAVLLWGVSTNTGWVSIWLSSLLPIRLPHFPCHHFTPYLVSQLQLAFAIVEHIRQYLGFVGAHQVVSVMVAHRCLFFFLMPEILHSLLQYSFALWRDLGSSTSGLHILNCQHELLPLQHGQLLL